MHPVHDIELPSDLAARIPTVIEIPRGSHLKYEVDKPTGLLMLDRVLFSAVHYPANYGLIPQTYYLDHDPLDILVICSEYLQPFSMLEARVVGIMHMRDNGEADDKIIAVAAKDISLEHIMDIEDLPPHTLHELKNFFEDYKKLEDKQVEVMDFKGKAEAYQCIDESMKR